MELFQIFWDEQNKLFLEFKKDEKEKQLILPNKIKRLTLQFEIFRFLKQQNYCRDPPYLIAVKKIYHSAESLSFSFGLDELKNFDDLQIKILKITIFLYSGQRIEYQITQNFKITDIGINEDCYSGLEYENLKLTKRVKNKVTYEKKIQKIKTIIHESIEKQTVIYENNQFEKLSEDNSLISLISESNKTLRRIEQELKTLSSSMGQMPKNYNQFAPSAPMRRSSEPGIVRIKRSTNPILIQGQTPSSKLMVIKEMKSIFKNNLENNSDFNIKEILKPLAEEELNLMILEDEELAKKEEIAIQNQFKRLKKQLKKEIHLENLKQPK